MAEKATSQKKPSPKLPGPSKSFGSHTVVTIEREGFNLNTFSKTCMQELT